SRRSPVISQSIHTTNLSDTRATLLRPCRRRTARDTSCRSRRAASCRGYSFGRVSGRTDPQLLRSTRSTPVAARSRPPARCAVASRSAVESRVDGGPAMTTPEQKAAKAREAAEEAARIAAEAAAAAEAAERELAEHRAAEHEGAGQALDDESSRSGAQRPAPDEGATASVEMATGADEAAAGGDEAAAGNDAPEADGGNAASASAAAREIAAGYASEGPAVELGTVVVDGVVDPAARVRIPLRTMNRHGLVAGATGTGKTKTLQGIAEQLSHAGVAVVLADIKGDLSGLSAPGVSDEKIAARAAETGAADWAPSGFPTEFLSLGTGGIGVPVRATISSSGPVLLSKVLGLNATQESSLGLIFHWADQQGLALLDLKDLRAVITHLTSAEGKADLKGIGGVSAQTAGVILRALVNLEAEGGDTFFGEPEFDPADLVRTAGGQGVITLFELGADRKSTRLNSSHVKISYAVFCLKKKKNSIT